MKYVIRDIKDVTDSKELLESNPPKFTFIFIFIVLSLLTSILIWSMLSEKEIIIKTTGVIEPIDKITKVSNVVASRITSIHFSEGDEVTEGQVLYTLENDDLKLQETSYDKKVSDYSKEIDNLNKLKSSVLDNKSYFLNNDDDKAYFEKYNIYLSNIKNNNVSVLKDLNNSLESLNLLKKSIEENKCYLDEGTSYYYQYIDYKLNLDKLNENLTESKNSLDDLKKSNSSIDQINTATTKIESINSDIVKLQNSTILTIVSNIEEINSKIKELSNNIDAEKYKAATISQIEDSLKIAENNLSDSTLNLNSIKQKIDQTIVKSECNGIITISNPINIGDMLQPGVQIASILPKSIDEFKLNIYVPNKDISTIKIGQPIQLSFLSLPQNEYGTISSKIDKISNTATVDEKTGSSYYIAEATIENTELVGYKNDSAELKNGMISQVNIITRKVSYFNYFLEQINFINSNK